VSVRRYVARAPEELPEVSGVLHDAYVDPEALTHHEDRGEVQLPFAQEAGWMRDLPQKELVRQTWRVREYRVPILKGLLTIRHVLDLEAPEGWGDMSMLLGLDHDAARGQLVLHAGLDPVRLTVERVDVTAEVTDERAFYVRRRVGRLTRVEGDEPEA